MVPACLLACQARDRFIDDADAGLSLGGVRPYGSRDSSNQNAAADGAHRAGDM